MIYGAPKVMCFAVDPDKHLIQVPAPTLIVSMANSPSADLSCEHRTKPVPPNPYRLVTDIDPALEQETLDLSEW